MDFDHVPVMLAEVLEYLDVRPQGTYVDGTVGGGGHSRAIARRLGPQGRLVGIDQDPAALQAAGQALAEFGGRISLVHANFREMDRVLQDLQISAVDGVLLDLGVSSHQFDTAERGFSYRTDAPLDMRMNPTQEVSARDLVNTADEAELVRILFDYGEERFARRIVARIVARRQRAAIETTGDLAALVTDAIPAATRRTGPHPARRTFQGLRIAVNDELGSLERGLGRAFDLLKPGGRLVVITFHSLEDRIAKQTFVDRARGCICPPHQPVCTCDRSPEARILTRKPVTAGEAELAANPRSRSAKLRALEKLAAL